MNVLPIGTGGTPSHVDSIMDQSSMRQNKEYILLISEITYHAVDYESECIFISSRHLLISFSLPAWVFFSCCLIVVVVLLNSFGLLQCFKWHRGVLFVDSTISCRLTTGNCLIFSFRSTRRISLFHHKVSSTGKILRRIRRLCCLKHGLKNFQLGIYDHAFEVIYLYTF